MKNQTVSQHVTAGFISGMSASIILQPLDYLKTRVQIDGLNIRTLVRSVQSPLDLWRGTLVSTIRTSCGGALYFTILSKTRHFISTLQIGKVEGKNESSSLPKLSKSLNLAAGAFARASAGIITMPLTVIKVHYEASTATQGYKSIGEAAKALYSSGGIRSFWKGSGVTTLRDAPSAGLYVLFYELNKETLCALLPGQQTTLMSSSINSMSALCASAASTTITSPFDTVKTRIQMNSSQTMTFVPVMLQIVRTHGVRGLFDGLSLRLMRKGFASAISWAIYENLIKR